MRAGLRLTDLLARLHVFAGAVPPVAPAGAAVGARAGDVEVALAGLNRASRASILDPLGRARAAARIGRPAVVALPFVVGGDRSAAADPVSLSPSGGQVARARDPGTSPRDVHPAMIAPARQIDQTTCGAAALVMLAMAGDPRLARWVAKDPARRFAGMQRRVHRACSHSGPVPWPRSLGTAPWAAAAVARFGEVRYTHRVVGGARRAEVLHAAITAASSGIPVPLYTGGDLRDGWQAAVPRHVVLLADAEVDGVARLYEPSSATLHAVPTATLLDPDAVTSPDRARLTAALGGWPHVVWAVLPR